MKLTLILLLWWIVATGVLGCSNQSNHLNNRIVTDSDGCKYVVQIGVGDTVFLNPLKDFKCSDEK